MIHIQQMQKHLIPFHFQDSIHRPDFSQACMQQVAITYILEELSDEFLSQIRIPSVSKLILCPTRILNFDSQMLSQVNPIVKHLIGIIVRIIKVVHGCEMWCYCKEVGPLNGVFPDRLTSVFLLFLFALLKLFAKTLLRSSRNLSLFAPRIQAMVDHESR